MIILINGVNSMKRKNVFGAGIAFSILAVALLISSAAAAPVANNVVESVNLERQCRENDDVFEKSDEGKNLAEKSETDNDPEEEPAGMFFCILKVSCSVNGFPCVATVKVKEINGDYDRSGKTYLLGSKFFFGLKLGHKYRITIEDTGQSRNVTITCVFDCENFCL